MKIRDLIWPEDRIEHNTRHALFAMCVVVASVRSVCASGWHDYALQIDPAYEIVRCNSLEVCLDRKNGPLVYVPEDHPRAGPIVGYNVTWSHIFLRTLGRSPRNLFQGDTFEDVDSSVEFFFIVDKSNDKLTGPMSLEEFQSHPIVADQETIKWTKPRNPNIIVPLIGNLMFLAASAIMFGWPVLLIVATVVIASIWSILRSCW